MGFQLYQLRLACVSCLGLGSTRNSHPQRHRLLQLFCSICTAVFVFDSAFCHRYSNLCTCRACSGCSPDGSKQLSFCRSHRARSAQGWLAESSVMKQQFYIIHSTPMPPANCTFMCMSTFESMIDAHAGYTACRLRLIFPRNCRMCKVLSSSK